ncbi:MAG: DUF1294 domain-containing protein [Lachnospiraceae bacterium]|nr:DUF1294 domain-containing protein [Lachnospiraceae bacterium]
MKELLIILGIVYLVAINLAGFFSMLRDKKLAQKKEWRVKESTLFLFAILGGSIGSIAGMWCFRHKTKHWYFVIGMPAILLLQIGIAVALYVCLK